MCIMIAVSDKMHKEELTGEISLGEFQRRCWQIQRRERPCPVMDTCEKFKQAGGVAVAPTPRQLEMFGTQTT